MTLDETAISKAIVTAYHQSLMGRIGGDVLIAGAGPAGLMAARDLARRGLAVTVLEKRLAPGGGIWGGGMGMCYVVVPDEVVPLLDELSIRHVAYGSGLHTLNAIELASRLCCLAIDAGAAVLNLVTVEDVCVHDGRLVGLVSNRSLVGDALPVDPITFSARAVLDTTGHEAVTVAALRRRNLLASTGLPDPVGEGPMNAAAGEEFVVKNVAEVYPGLWLAGMSVCAALRGPRMGPTFGGMLLSGRVAAERIAASLAEAPPGRKGLVQCGADWTADTQHWLRSPAEQFLERIGVASGAVVMDFGCRGGAYALPSARLAGQSGKVYAVDRDECTLHEVAQRAAAQGLANLHCINTRGDVHVPLDDGSVDVVLLYDVIHLIGWLDSPRRRSTPADRRRLLAEMHRISRPGALLSVFLRHLDSHTDASSEEQIRREIESSGFRFSGDLYAPLLHSDHLTVGHVLNFKRENPTGRETQVTNEPEPRGQRETLHE